ncbi:MAG TPA: hypothetical protein VEN81_02655, partial [Planctomycetota bacterium]|nr:hypothetical protein [Planctomycetota bacterium]
MLAWSLFWGCLWLGGHAQEPDEASIQRLVEQLGADFLEERDAARKALEKVGKKGELRLIAGLASNDHRIRRNCLELLTEIKSEKSMERGGELFRADEDASVRDAAFKLLQS